MKSSIVLPHLAHLTFIEPSLFSFFRKAESTPKVQISYFAVSVGMGFVPAFSAAGLIAVIHLSF
jgi:hypothetical protein